MISSCSDAVVNWLERSTCNAESMGSIPPKAVFHLLLDSVLYDTGRGNEAKIFECS